MTIRETLERMYETDPQRAIDWANMLLAIEREQAKRVTRVDDPWERVRRYAIERASWPTQPRCGEPS